MLLASMLFMAITQVATAGYIYPEKKLTTLEAMGISDLNQINSGYVMSLEKGVAKEMTDAEILSFYYDAQSQELSRRIIKNPFSGVAIVLRTDEGDKPYFINSGVQVGKFGESNYLCYIPSEDSDAVGKIYTSFMSFKNKYNHSTFTINDEYDYLVFPDNQWAVEDVLYSAQHSLLPFEIMNSYGKAISREEFCILVANYISACWNYKSLDDYYIQRDMAYLSNYFVDTLGCDSSINMLVGLGVVNGKDDNRFGPGDALTREEAAVILKNAAIAAGKDLDIGSVSFSDMKNVSKWAVDAVKAVGSNGVMNGTDGKFSPKEFITTEQAIAGINKLFKIQR